MKEEIDIVKILIPNEGELTKDEEGTYHVTLADAELDPLKCTFHNDDCIEIDTSEMTYITIDSHTLNKMIGLIYETEELYENERTH